MGVKTYKSAGSIFGEKHPTTIRAMQNLAHYCFGLGKYREVLDNRTFTSTPLVS
ncbi:MAG: tetratricopeptide repeat protein [Synergistaceae bacterium]|nr:tetratricopeptide repeat protein [Synergistaceae bacterium]